MGSSSHALRVFLLLAATAAASGCAGTRERPAASTAPEAKAAAAAGDDAYPYRFDMTQHGKKMSADDFDAWMKARGLRIAKGTPAKGADTSKGKVASSRSAKGARD